MKRENLILLINAIVMALIGVVFVVLTTRTLPNEPTDYLFSQAVTLRDTEEIEAVPDTTSYEIIHQKSEAYSVSGKHLGTVYNVQFKNSFGYSENSAGAGYVELLIGITAEGLVSVEVVELIQSSWTIRGIQKAIYDAFQDVNYLEVKNIPSINVADLDAGMTASASTSTIRSLVNRVVNLHFDIITGPADLFEEVYGVGYGRTLDSNFNDMTNENVLGRDTVTNYDGNLVGYIYQITGTTMYNDQESKSADITIYVGVDLENEILAIELPVDEYHHSSGDFYYGGTVIFAGTLIGYQVDEVDDAILDQPDLVSAPSNSKKLVVELIYALETILYGERQEPELVGVIEAVSLQAGSLYDPLVGITANDIQDGDITSSIELIDFDLVDLNVAGEYTYTVSITDADLNTTTKEVVITVTGFPIQMFDSVYGNGYVATTDVTFLVTETFLFKLEIRDQEDNLLGYVYKLTGTTIYNDYDMASGSIAVYVALDLTNTILDIELPSAEYNHSKGGYYSQSVAFVDQFTGENLSDVRLIGTDLLAGSTARSRNLITDLLEDLKEVLLG